MMYFKKDADKVAENLVAGKVKKFNAVFAVHRGINNIVGFCVKFLSAFCGIYCFAII